jgi:hypothetical protein
MQWDICLMTSEQEKRYGSYQIETERTLALSLPDGRRNARATQE